MELREQLERSEDLRQSRQQLSHNALTVRGQGREIQRLTAVNKELRNSLEIERVKAVTFREDFEQERRDRESAHTKVTEMETHYTHQLQSVREELHRTATELDACKQDLAVMRKHSQKMKQKLADKEREAGQMNQEIAHLCEEVQSKTQQHRKDRERLQQQLRRQENTAQQQLQLLQQRLDAALAEVQHLQYSPQIASKSDKPWNVSRQEVQILREIGRGAWGTVFKGKFRSQQVAVKQPHPDILSEHTIKRLRREVNIMANIRHPNLLQLIGAVFDDEVPRQPPLIILELLDMNLRQAYQKKRHLESSRVPIFRDVAYALHYLHERQEPIIHRDVSAPNILLEALPNKMWRAKVSDFGSANLARLAHTMAEGTIVYAAPETIPQARELSSPPLRQTTKIDVYSYGILLCEVILSQQPDPECFWIMLQQVERQWPFMHKLILSCTNKIADERPTMAEVLDQLNTLP